MQLRTQFQLFHCTVRGYPSNGGIIIGSLSAVELAWLNLSRSHATSRSQDQHSEDAFCYQLLRLGAQWWKSETFYKQRHDQISGGYPWPDDFPPVLHVGYPLSGGVWVLKLLNGEELPDEYAKVEMAFTMDERCEGLEAVGATFYADVGEYEGIAKSLEHGIAIGKRWEERMKVIDE